MAANDNILYEPDERCPPLLSVVVAIQSVMLTLASTVLYVSIIAQASGQGDRYLAWAVFSSMVICGAVAALQAARLGRLGAGHPLTTGSAPDFLAVSLLALTVGGPAMLASLLVISALFQFTLAAFLPLLRRIITPVISGTVLILIAVTVLPIVVGRLQDIPEGTSAAAAPLAAAATIAVAVMLGLRGSGKWRLWASLIGMAAGCVVAALFGMYDAQRVIDAPWFGVPRIAAPGFDLSFGMEFWALLPMFLVVTLAITIRTVGSAVVIQRVSRRSPRVTDFRLVQGAVNAGGAGTLLAGIAGTLPPAFYVAVNVSLINFTGVAARSVGYTVCGILVALALFSKVSALILTIPGPVIGAFITIVMGLLIVEGMRAIVQDGLDHRKALVVGVALAVGVGLHNSDIFAEVVGGTWGTLLGNGMTVGTIAAILMNVFLELTSPRRRRLEAGLDASAFPRLDDFLTGIASGVRWNDASTNRLRLVGEEALSSLLREDEEGAESHARRLIVLARPAAGRVELEFLAVFEEENLEDRLAYLNEQGEVADEHEISLRLLRHYAASVSHRQYHGIDIVTVEVEGSR